MLMTIMMIGEIQLIIARSKKIEIRMMETRMILVTHVIIAQMLRISSNPIVIMMT